MSSTSIIRLAHVDDAAQVQRLYAPYVLDTPISFEVEPPSVEEMQRRIARTLPRYPWLVCVHHGEIIGYAYAGAHRDRAAYQWSVDVAVYIHPQSQRSGVGRALYSSLLEILTLQGFYNAYAGVTLPNPASVGLHEAVGFRPLGVYESVGYKAGAWHSVGWWQLALREHSPSPDPTLALDEVQGQDAWQTAMSAGVSSLKV